MFTQDDEQDRCMMHELADLHHDSKAMCVPASMLVANMGKTISFAEFQTLVLDGRAHRLRSYPDLRIFTMAHDSKLPDDAMEDVTRNCVANHRFTHGRRADIRCQLKDGSG